MKRVCLWLCVVLGACQGEVPATPTGAPNARVQRVVSLAPHLTELMYSADAGELLVGVIAYSDYPPAAQALPRVGDAFRVDQERLAALAPDLVLAWDGGNPHGLIEDLKNAGYRVETFPAGALAQVAANLRRIGELTDRADTADAAAGRYESELSALRAHHANDARLRVFFQTSAQPIYTINGAHAISQALDLCGGENVFARLPSASANVSEEAVIAADPDVMMSAGDDTNLAKWRAHTGLRAVGAGRLYGVDPDLITRESLRILDGVRQICAHLSAARAAH